MHYTVLCTTLYNIVHYTVLCTTLYCALHCIILCTTLYCTLHCIVHYTVYACKIHACVMYLPKGVAYLSTGLLSSPLPHGIVNTKPVITAANIILSPIIAALSIGVLVNSLSSNVTFSVKTDVVCLRIALVSKSCQ